MHALTSSQTPAHQKNTWQTSDLFVQSFLAVRALAWVRILGHLRPGGREQAGHGRDAAGHPVQVLVDVGAAEGGAGDGGRKDEGAHLGQRLAGRSGLGGRRRPAVQEGEGGQGRRAAELGGKWGG